MSHNPRHGADPGVTIGGFTPPTTPAQNTGQFGAFFGAGASSDPIPGGTMQPASGNQFAQYQQAADTMQQAGIGSLSGATTDTTQGQAAAAIQNAFQQSQGTGSGQDNDAQTLTEKVKETTKKIVDVFTGEEIKQLDKLQLQAAQNLLNQYQKLGINNPLKLRALMTSNIFGGIFGKDQTVSDMEGNIVDPKNAFDDTGNLKEGFRFTKEGIIGQLENIDPESNIMESLKKFNPELYYPLQGMPATSGGLVDLANIQVTEEMQGANPELAKMIFDARMELDRMGKNPFTGNPQGGGQGGGGGTYIPPVTPPVDPTDPIPPQQPTLPPGITPPLNPSTRFPDSVIRDYTQLGLPQIYGNQQMPNYATFNRAGSMPVGLQNYLDALRNRFGIG